MTLHRSSDRSGQGPGGSSKLHRTVSSANCSASTTSRMQAATFCGTRPITLPLPARAFRKAQAGTSEHLAEPWHTGLHTSHVVSHQSLRGSAAHCNHAFDIGAGLPTTAHNHHRIISRSEKTVCRKMRTVDCISRQLASAYIATTAWFCDPSN